MYKTMIVNRQAVNVITAVWFKCIIRLRRGLFLNREKFRFLPEFERGLGERL